jgi:hypothetical protein
MGPQQQPRDAVPACQRHRNVAAAVALGLQRGVADQTERYVQGHGEGDANAHHDPLVGYRVDRCLRRRPGEHQQDRQGAQGQTQQGQGRQAGVQGGCPFTQRSRDAPRDHQAEVDGYLVEMEGASGERPPRGAALPEQGFPGGQGCWKPAYGFGFVLGDHISGSCR